MVNDPSPSAATNGAGRRHPAAEGAPAQLRELADLGASLGDGAACLIAWQGVGKATTIRTAADPRAVSLLDALLAAVERDPRYRANRSAGVLRLSHQELAAACGPQHQAITAAAVAVSNAASGADDMRAIVILTRPRTPHSRELAVTAELMAVAAIAIIRAAIADASRDFWSARASESAERLSRARSESADASSERSRIDRAAAAAQKLRSRDRFNKLGALFTKLGGFDAWIVATSEDDVLRLCGVSGVLTPAAIVHAQRSQASALTECFLKRATIIRTAQQAASAVYDEDRAFARFNGYLCVPFEEGAIALAGRAAPDGPTVARIEALAARLNPLLGKWRLEAETDRLRRLVRNLGLRMYGAIDSERARIARDLHDHQAQLLTAARIGIEAGPDEARGIFKQLEDALRLRVRELRPPTLGRSTLAEGLRYELRRLTDAGIKGRLLHADKMNALTRPVQQICYQVAREALANVARHAGASRVEISLEKRRRLVRLSILDNGKGIANPGARGGIGLSGLNERLELMGGRLRVESRAGSTRLVAEIPETA